jgi:hypothetical protein
MSASMPSLEEYQTFIYTLAASFPLVESSTLVIRWVDEDTRWFTGEVFFAHDIRLHVSEVINFSRRAIVRYGYEIYRGDERLYCMIRSPIPTTLHLRVPILTTSISLLTSDIIASPHPS